MEETFTTITEAHPSGLNRAARVLAGVLAGILAGIALGWLLTVPGFLLHGRIYFTLSLFMGLIAGLGVGIGLARYGELSFGLVMGMVGYVVLGLAGYALLFGLIGLVIRGAAGLQTGLVIGAVVGTAVGVYARLIKYRYRHF